MAVALLGAVTTLEASALIINDNYTGGMDAIIFPTYHVARDVIGSGRDGLYEVYSMDVTTAGSVLSVTVNTNFIESDPSNNGGYVPGDLFISADGWTPFAGASGAPYHEDDHSNGTTWEYAFDSTAGTVLAITDADIEVLDSSDCCRIGQEVLVTGGTDTGAGISYSGPVASASGIWAYEYTYLFDYTLLGLGAGDQIGLHWSMTCGNDVIEGAYTIPRSVQVSEPGTALLMLVGAGALLMSRRRMATSI